MNNTPRGVPQFDPRTDVINPNDLLTGEDLSQNQTQDPVIPIRKMETLNPSDIPDLHKLEQSPNAVRRGEISKQVETTLLNKVETLEDKIKRDIESAQQQKFSNMPRDPKEILKQIIAKGEYRETIELYGHKWTLKALDQNDTLLSLDEVRDSVATQSGRIIALMFGTVMYALEAIDEISITEWFPEITLAMYKGNRMEYYIAVKRAVRSYLEALPPAVIDSLYMKYEEIDSKRNQGLSELKNS
jgi:hypothetical protein